MPFDLTELTGERPPFVAGTFFDLARVGYVQAEYALHTTARAFAPSDDGLSVVEEADVTTRVLVYRPADAAAFNGTVVVEWLNVSGGLDAAPLWVFTHRELIRSGAAWIGVSAQQLGIHGGQAVLEMAAMALRDLDPERYGSLHHPGDRFSYDVFATAGELAHSGAGTILEGLDVQDRVLAVGESQSAFRLTTYVNEVDAIAPVFDGYLVHARGGTGAPFDDERDPRALREGPPAPFRTDLRAPVLCVEAETDLITLGYRAARQDDGERLVVWEITGASHADAYTFVAGFADDGLQPVEDLARGWLPTPDVVGAHLDAPVNVGPQHYVMNAAVRALDAWVASGVRPPTSPRLEVSGDGYGFATDELGNALGGIRTPHVDVPVAVLSGLGNSGHPVAFLAGTTLPFTRDRLVELYGTKAAFVERFRASAEEAVAAGFFLADDLEELVAIAAHNVDLD